MKFAEQYFEKGDYDKAKVEYGNVLRMDPSEPLSFQRLGTIWLEEGAPYRAASFLSKACELEPKKAINQCKFASALAALGRNEEARKHLLSVLDDFPNDEEALLLLADTNRTTGDAAETEERLSRFQHRDSVTGLLVAANLAVQKSEATAAEVLLQRAIAAAPASARAHLALANYRLLRQDTAAAEEELKKAVGLSPFRSATRMRYVDFKIESGAEAEARKILQEITKHAPDYLSAWCRLSQLSLNRQRFREALEFLDNVFSRDPTNVEAKAIQIEIFLASGESQRAVRVAEELDNTYKNVPSIQYQLARTYVRNNDRAQARALLNLAIAANPDFVDAILLLGELDLESGNARLVIESINRLLEKRPGLAPAELLLIEAYLSSGQFDEAAAVAQRQAEASPDAPDPYDRLGLILTRMGKLDEARKAFEKVLELRPGNLLAINQIVDADIAMNRFDAAMAMVERQVESVPDRAMVFFLRGKVFAAQGKTDEAEATLLKALELDPNSLGTHQLLISTYLVENKFTEAINNLRNLLEKNPKERWALKTLARACEATGDFGQARDSYEALLALEPTSVDTLEKLAVLYSEHLDALDKAYERAVQARSLDAVDPRVADTLGWIQYRRHDYQQALALTQQAVDKLGDDPAVQFHFAVASYMMNRLEPARAAFAKAAEAPIDFKGKEEAHRWLALLNDSPNAPEPLSAADLDALIEQRPDDAVARARRAALWEKQGDSRKAAAQYEAAIRINRKLLDPTVKLAQLYAGPLHDLPKALELAKAARDIDKDNPDTTRLVANIAFRAGNFSWAYNLMIQCAHMRGDDGEIAYDLAWAAYSVGRVTEAEQSMRRAVDLGLQGDRSSDANLFLRLIAALRDAPERLKQNTAAEETLKEKPDYVPALMIRAEAEERSDVKASIATYGVILNRFPDFAPAQKQLAELYLRGESPAYDKAYDLAVKARATLPDDPDLARNLGILSFRRRNFAYAAQLLSESARAKQLDPTSLFYLGISYSQIRQPFESRAALSESLAAGLRDPLASEARGALAELDSKRKISPQN